MPVPQIAQLPDPPVRSDAPVDFSLKADVFLGGLPGFGQQTNMVATFINGRALSATESATIAYNHSQAAASSAAAAASSAQQAQTIAASTASDIRNEVSLDLASATAAAQAAGQSASTAASASSLATSSASSAAQSASAAESSAVRAEYAAEYVENMTDGAAPLNSPLFTGDPRAPTPAQGDDSQSLATTAFVQEEVGGLGLGTAATRDVGTGSGNVMEVGVGGWLGVAPSESYISGFPQDYSQSVSQIYRILEHDGPVAPYSTSIHIAANDTWGRLRVDPFYQQAWIQGGVSTAGTGWTAELHHTGNIRTTTGQSTNFPMTQKAVTDAINAAVANIDVSGPRPVKDHGEVATAGSQTVVCNVQESDFHIMSMQSADATGTLTIDFANMPDTIGKHFSWHVRLRRGGRNPVEFVQPVTWAGGQPVLGTNTNQYDLIMFYKVDSETIRAMVVDAY